MLLATSLTRKNIEITRQIILKIIEIFRNMISVCRLFIKIYAIYYHLLIENFQEKNAKEIRKRKFPYLTIRHNVI